MQIKKYNDMKCYVNPYKLHDLNLKSTIVVGMPILYLYYLHTRRPIVYNIAKS